MANIVATCLIAAREALTAAISGSGVSSILPEEPLPTEFFVIPLKNFINNN